MPLLEEYGIDESTCFDWDAMKEEVKHLSLSEVEEILSRRRHPSEPSMEWRFWQNALKWRQACLIGGSM